MIKKLEKNEVPKGYIPFMIFSTAKTEYLFFEIEHKLPKILEEHGDSLSKYLSQIACRVLPKGIIGIEAMEENHIFRIDYDPDITTERKASEYAHSLNL